MILPLLALSVAALQAAAQEDVVGPREPRPTAPVDRAEVARAVDEYLAASRPPAPPSAWERALARLTLYGDFRLRAEADLRGDDTPDRERFRQRTRLGVNYEFRDDLLFGVRVVTGDPDDPNSSATTFSDGFDDIELSLDRAFLQWRPRGAPGLTLTGGKFTQGWRVDPIYGELVWDADIQPEGARLDWSWSGEGRVRRVDVHLGQYVASEHSQATDAYNTQVQVDARLALSPQWSLDAALGYYAVTNPDALFDRNRGNATRDASGGGMPDAYASEFSILNPILTLERPVRGLPLHLSLQSFSNLRAASGRDTGYSVGAALGRMREKGDWRGYLQWMRIEQDAVFSPFAQDDFLEATNFSGAVMGARYQVADGVGLHLWTLVTDPLTGPTPEDPSWRLRLDLDMRF